MLRQFKSRVAKLRSRVRLDVLWLRLKEAAYARARPTPASMCVCALTRHNIEP
jgi:hypothetical protein